MENKDYRSFEFINDAIGNRPLFVQFEVNPLWLATGLDIAVQASKRSSVTFVLFEKSLLKPFRRINSSSRRIKFRNLTKVFSLIFDFCFRTFFLNRYLNFFKTHYPSIQLVIKNTKSSCRLTGDAAKKKKQIDSQCFPSIQQIEHIVEINLNEEYAFSYIYRKFLKRYRFNLYVRSCIDVGNQILEILDSSEYSSLVVMNGRIMHESIIRIIAENLGYPVIALDHNIYGNRVQSFESHCLNADYILEISNNLWEQYNASTEGQFLVKVSNETFFSDRSKNSTVNHFLKSYSANNFSTHTEGEVAKTILLLTSSNDELEAYAFLTGKPKVNQISVINEFVEWFDCFNINETSGYTLIIRIHPNTKFKDKQVRNGFNTLKEKNNVKIYGAFSDINTFDLLHRSDIVISFDTSLSLDAAYLKKSSFSLYDGFFSSLGVTKNIMGENFQNILETDFKCLEVHKQNSQKVALFQSDFGAEMLYFDAKTYEWYHRSNSIIVDPIRHAKSLVSQSLLRFAKQTGKGRS